MAESFNVPCEESTQKVENETREKSVATANSCAKRQDCGIDTDIDLFLLGKTGNGKSATGNSILQYPAFKSSASMNSVTTEVNFDYTEFNGRVIKVVDVRGVQDTRETTAMSTALFIREMEYAVVTNPKGYHAFLIVLKYGNRLTQEEVNTIKFLKAVFGETFVKDYCIIIVTGGDMFYGDPNLEGLSFTTWCEEEQNTNINFKELLQECSHRIVLFNNWSKDEAEKNKQVIELINLVDQLKGIRYTNDNFIQAKLAHTELIMQSEMGDIRQYALKEERLIFQKLKSCQESLFDELVALENLLVRTEALMENVLGLDKKTKVLQDFIDNIAAIKYNISLEIKVHVDIRKWRKSFKETQENLYLKVASEKKKLTNQYLKSIANCSDDIKKRLKKELDENIKQCETILEQEKKVKEEEFFREINKRREKLKLERLKQEAKFQEIKSKHIEHFISSVKKRFSEVFQFSMSIYLNTLRIGH